jgi:biotin operon repressor
MEALFVAKNAIGDFRLRTIVGKELYVVEQGNVYEEKIPQDRIDELMDTAIDEELLRTQILLLTKEEPRSVKYLSEKMKVPSKEVLKHIVTLRDRNLIGLDGIKDTTPYYKALSQEVEA